MKPTRWFLLVFALAAGCAPVSSTRWFREDVHPVAVKGDRLLDQAKIWTRDSVMQWRVVLITRDSISGIPYSLPAACSGCRVVLPVAAVDSLSVGYQSGGKGGGGSDDDSKSPVWLPLLILALVLCP